MPLSMNTNSNLKSISNKSSMNNYVKSNIENINKNNNKRVDNKKRRYIYDNDNNHDKISNYTNIMKY